MGCKNVTQWRESQATSVQCEKATVYRPRCVREHFYGVSLFQIAHYAVMLTGLDYFAIVLKLHRLCKV